MFFGATSFAAAPFAGVGVINVTVQPTGNQINAAIGNVQVDLVTRVSVTGQRFNLATGDSFVVSWNGIDPGATQIWTPIDPDNP